MGSSGGSASQAQQQADQAERERQQQIAAATGQINSIFDSPGRQAQYDKITSDTTQYYTDELNRQKAINDRKLKFALARSGLGGSSVQADESQKLGEDYLKGVIEASRRGQSAGASLRAADEQTRTNLIGMAQAGLDATTASTQATNQLRNNLLSSQSDATANQLGDMFGDLSSIYDASKQAADYRRGLRDYSQFGSPYYKPLYGY